MWEELGYKLPSVVEKMYGQTLIDCGLESTDLGIREEQFGFRNDRSLSNQIFHVKWFCEKMERGKWFFFRSLNFKQTSLKVDRDIP